MYAQARVGREPNPRQNQRINMKTLLPRIPRFVFLLGLISLIAPNPVHAQKAIDPDQPALVPVDSLIAQEGMEVSVWATSPMFFNPTNMDIDHHGRVWVAEGKNYRMFRNRALYNPDAKGDRIMVLTDTDHDGKADKSHVFVQETALVAPLGVAVIDNKVVVSQPPSIIVYTDVDRNAVFDARGDHRPERRLVFQLRQRRHPHRHRQVGVDPARWQRL